MKYDLYSIRQNSTTLSADVDVINSIKNSDVTKHGFRRFENGRIYQTSKVGTTNLDQLVAESKKWGGEGQIFNQAFAQAQSIKKHDSKTYDFQLEHFKEALDLLHTKYPHFVFKGTCSLGQVSYELKSDYGLDLTTSGYHLHWHVIYQRKGSGGSFDGYVAGAGVGSNILATVKEHSKYLDAYDKVVDIRDGHYPVILGDAEDSFAPFAKLKESFSAHKYHENAVLFNGQLGQKLFSDKVSILDQGYDVEENNLKYFDGEGTVRVEDLFMIENGVFKNLFYDIRFAEKYKAKSTGNGLRSYDSGIGLSPRHLYFKPGKKSLKSILKDLDKCIFVNIAAGGDSNELGEYSTPAQVAYVYEKGELIGRAPQLTLKTSVQRALNQDLVDISSDDLNGNPGQGMLISSMDVFKN